MKSYLRLIPPVHELQKDRRFNELTNTFSITSEEATAVLKEILSKARTSMIEERWAGATPGSIDFTQQIFSELKEQLQTIYSYTLKSVINATGTILHTNLGRARLSDSAIQHVIETAQNYSNLEYNLEQGERGSRHVHVEKLIQHLTGAEAAMVVNNNAAAVYFILRGLAKGKKVIVSRGQLVEIGGSFRVSSIMEESGAHLVEVGTTNKTHRYDYEQAIDDETAILLKVHTSNFKMIGFTKTVESSELVDIAKQHRSVIVYEDLGSGALFPYADYGIGEEPVVSDVLQLGVDLVSFSGDKLLGGPQAGIIAGRKDLIDVLKKHQLARVLRVDKMTLAALEGTLLDYTKREEITKTIPVVRDLLQSKEEIEARALAFASYINEALSLDWEAKVVDATSQVGGGTMPEVQLPTNVIMLKHRQMAAEMIARKLRGNHPPIIVRIQKEEIILDLRTVTTDEEALIKNALLHLK